MNNEQQLTPELVAEWETKLSEFGLSEDQLKDNVVDRTQDITKADRKALRKKILNKVNFEEISSFGFVSNNSTPRKDTPAWILDNTLVKKFLLKRFPDFRRKGSRDNKAGTRWGYILNEFFRENRTAKSIGRDLNLSVKAVNGIIYRIRRINAEE